MLANKHIDMDKPVAELYYYGTVYNHSPAVFKWFRIGSDLRQFLLYLGGNQAAFYASAEVEQYQ